MMNIYYLLIHFLKVYSLGDYIDRMMIVFEGKLLSRKGPFEEEKIILEKEILFREALKE